MNPGPRLLESTRVYRFYRGGKLLGEFRGCPEDDGTFPEDWICSVTRANNPGRDEPDAGLTRLAGGGFLRDLILEDPIFWLGQEHIERFGPTPGVLVKLLDTAERLPVHAHPSRAFANQHLSSPFGKTEAWVVLATRDPYGEVHVGLQESVNPGQYLEWIERQQTSQLLDSLNRVDVQRGDVIFVPAGVPHAIGAGILIAELQEPTDLSLVCEWEGFPIEPGDSHLGLGWRRAAEAIDVRGHEPIFGIPDDARGFFGVDYKLEAAGRFALSLVLEGRGSIAGHSVRAGDALAVPAGADELYATGNLRVLRCLAPEAGGA